MIQRFGTYSTSRAIHAGLDLEMPGPGRFRGVNLGHAITTNKVPTHVLNTRAKQMLKLIDRCAASKVPENAPETEIDSPESRAILREVACSSIVLLKNENQVLPLSKSKPVSFRCYSRYLKLEAKINESQDCNHWP